MTVFDTVRRASDACVLANPQVENAYFLVYIFMQCNIFTVILLNKVFLGSV